MRRFLDKLRNLWRDRRGALVSEFAASLPMLLILVMSGFECSRYVILNQKLDRVTTTIADLVAQEVDMTSAEMTALFDAVSPLISPYPFGVKGKMIVTSVVLNAAGTTKIVAWQRTHGSLNKNSKIGAPAGTATLPAEMPLRVNETIIVGEVFYDFVPFFVTNWFSSTPLAQTLYHRAFYRPRFGALTTIS